MDRMLAWVFLISIFLVLPITNSEQENVKQSLVQFMVKLSEGNARNDPNWGWNMSSDPCNDKWMGVSCDTQAQNVKKIVLEKFNFTGVFDASSVCMAKSLTLLSVKGNSIGGLMPTEIGNCKQLTHLYVGGNRFSGDLSDSLTQLSNLKRLDISNNNFFGKLPHNLSRISGLVSFFAQNNQINGAIPGFEFSNFKDFNVSNNNFSGQIPDVKGKFSADSFSGNPELCGQPLMKACPPSAPVPAPPSEMEKEKSPSDQFLIFSGYIMLVLVLVILFGLQMFIRKRSKEKKINVVKNGVAANTCVEPTSASSDFKTVGNRSEYSITPVEGGRTSSSLVVLSSPVVKGLRFEDVLRAPAELLGRGKNGSLYKVILNDGTVLAVKRIKDWRISSEDFGRRMQRIDQVKHPRVLPVVAFYCSKHEKLLVYEYQTKGSLFKLLHGSQSGQVFDWGNRLSVAAAIAEALACMHKQLREDGIAHGNLKSTNILFNKNTEPCISEYGLMVVEKQDQSFPSQSDSFKDNALGKSRVYSTLKVDVHGFGAILLELLTGKLVQNNGFDLARWVHSVVREEWTVEVFDKALITEGASEERMVNLLQLALKCINPSPNERPSLHQIAVMIKAIKDEEDRSTSSEL